MMEETEVPFTEESPTPQRRNRKERIVSCFNNLANCLFPWRQVAQTEPVSGYANEEEKGIVEAAVALAIRASLTNELEDTI